MNDKLKKTLISVGIFLVAVAIMALAEWRRPKPPIIVNQVVEQCSPAKRSHLEALDQRWRYLASGPLYDLCFAFTGTIANALGEPRSEAFTATTAIHADVCIAFTPTDAQNMIIKADESWGYVGGHWATAHINEGH